MYLDSLIVTKFSFSTNLTTSWPKIGRYGIKLKTPINSFGNPSALTFHNWIRGPFMGLQMLSISETLYYIINQLDESTKKFKRCKSICPTKVSKLSFKQPRA
jgi:hypothetical protein